MAKTIYPLMSDITYEMVRDGAQVILPALGTLYVALAKIWGLPFAEEVMGTIVSINLFLGVLAKVAAKRYNASEEKFDGEIDVVEDGSNKKFELNLYSDPYDMDLKQEVVFKINK